MRSWLAMGRRWPPQFKEETLLWQGIKTDLHQLQSGDVLHLCNESPIGVVGWGEVTDRYLESDVTRTWGVSAVWGGWLDHSADPIRVPDHLLPRCGDPLEFVLLTDAEARLVQKRLVASGCTMVRTLPTGPDLSATPEAVPELAMRIFLSYASEDRETVYGVKQYLTSIPGVSAWIDVDEIMPGQEWLYEIRRAVRQAHMVVVCLSRKSISKEGFVQREIREALDIAQEKPQGTIFVVPLRLEECAVPHTLLDWQWVDWFAANGMQRLTTSVRARAKTLGVALGEPPTTQLPAWLGTRASEIRELEEDLRAGVADRTAAREALDRILRMAHETQSEALLRTHDRLRKLFDQASFSV